MTDIPENALSALSQLTDMVSEHVDGEGGEGLSTVAQVASAAAAAARTVNSVQQMVNGPSAARDAANQGIGAAGDLLAGATGLEGLTYHFRGPNVEDGALSVESFSLKEALNELYECTVDLSVRGGNSAHGENLLGMPVSVVLYRGAQERQVNGIASRVERLSLHAGLLRVRVTVVPAAYALSRNQTSRIFQDQTALEIAKDVLTEGLAEFEREVRLDTGDILYPAREYCVQYQESDWDFVSRLLAEEGIGLYFEQENSVETIVLTNSNMNYKSKGAPVQLEDRPDRMTDTEAFNTFSWLEQLEPSRVVALDFDWDTTGLHNRSRGW